MKTKPVFRDFLYDNLDRMAAHDDVEDAEFRVFYALTRKAEKHGKAWPGLRTLEKACTISKSWIIKVLPALSKIARFRIDKLKPGDTLPSGSKTVQKRNLYVLCEFIDGVPSFPTGTPQGGEPTSPPSPSQGGVPTSPPPVNSVHHQGEPSSPPLHEPSYEPLQKEPGRARDRFERPISLRKQLKKMSCEILDGKLFSLHDLKQLVAEAVGDKVPLPPELVDILSNLEQHGWIELNQLGGIESVSGNEPICLSTMHEREPSHQAEEKMATLVAAIASEVEL